MNHRQELPPLVLFTSSRYQEDLFNHHLPLFFESAPHLSRAIVHGLHHIQYENVWHAFMKHAAAEAVAAGRETLPCRHMQSQPTTESVALCFHLLSENAENVQTHKPKVQESTCISLIPS